MITSFTTERLLIRPLRLGDSAAVYAFRSDPDVVRYQMWRPAREGEVRDFIRSILGMTPGMPGIWFQFAVVRQADAAVIGDCGIHVPLDVTDGAELGLTLATAFQGKGYATEALGAIIRYCFEHLHLRHLFARMHRDNHRSIALIDRCGFTPSKPGTYGLPDEDDEEFYVMEYAVWKTRQATARR